MFSQLSLKINPYVFFYACTQLIYLCTISYQKVHKASYSGILYTPLRCTIFFTNHQRDWKFLVNSIRISGYRFPSSYCSYALTLVCIVDPFLLPINVLHKRAVTNESVTGFLIFASWFRCIACAPSTV